ncbi:MAG: hypothetical protein ACRC92_27345 [Peptostreptococcaceae bacterium]
MLIISKQTNSVMYEIHNVESKVKLPYLFISANRVNDVVISGRPERAIGCSDFDALLSTFVEIKEGENPKDFVITTIGGNETIVVGIPLAEEIK